MTSISKMLKQYRETQNLKKIARRYGGQWNLSRQCCECDYYTPSHYEDRPSNFGCHYPGELKSNHFHGHTCLVWKERTKANPIHLVTSFPRSIPK